jgi:glutamate formiminotransferase
MLLAVPNVSEGRDRTALGAIGAAFGPGVFHVHADPDHHRAVFALAGEPGELAQAMLAGAREAVARIDLTQHRGVHPRVGAIDVAPVVYLDDADRGAAVAEALVLGDLLGAELGLPVYLYGALGGGRTRAELRRPGGLDGIRPDFGPERLHPTAGAVLVAARPPLIAFNVEIEGTLEDARRIAAAIREGGADGLPGVRALGLELPARGGVAQVSVNVEDHRAVPLAVLVEAVARRAEVAETELVGLAPEAAFAGFPEQVRVRNRRTVEQALSS